MTQFALVKTSNICPCLKPVQKLGNDFLLGIADKLFPASSIGEIFVLDVGGVDIDSLMLDAQRVVIESFRFEGTELHSAISEVAEVADELVFWYGSDYDALECVYDVSGLLSKLEEAVGESTCELYIHYKASK